MFPSGIIALAVEVPPHRGSGGSPMDIEEVVAVIVGVGLLVYLIYALIRAEEF
jgi:K+-transporting ATPase KdpF subunit